MKAMYRVLVAMWMMAILGILYFKTWESAPPPREMIKSEKEVQLVLADETEKLTADEGKNEENVNTLNEKDFHYDDVNVVLKKYSKSEKEYRITQEKIVDPFDSDEKESEEDAVMAQVPGETPLEENTFLNPTISVGSDEKLIPPPPPPLKLPKSENDIVPVEIHKLADSESQEKNIDSKNVKEFQNDDEDKVEADASESEEKLEKLPQDIIRDPFSSEKDDEKDEEIIASPKMETEVREDRLPKKDTNPHNGDEDNVAVDASNSDEKLDGLPQDKKSDPLSSEKDTEDVITGEDGKLDVDASKSDQRLNRLPQDKKSGPLSSEKDDEGVITSPKMETEVQEDRLLKKDTHPHNGDDENVGIDVSKSEDKLDGLPKDKISEPLSSEKDDEKDEKKITSLKMETEVREERLPKKDTILHVNISVKPDKKPFIPPKPEPYEEQPESESDPQSEEEEEGADEEEDPNTSLEDDKEPSVKKKLILFGTNWWHPHYPFLKETAQLCPLCTFTEKKSLFNSSDAVVFHAITMKETPPSYRPKNQIWIYLFFETQAYQQWRLNTTKSYDNMFNLTMTYRRDSDIVVPYGRFFSKSEKSPPSFDTKWAFVPGAVPHSDGLYENSAFKIPTIEELKGRKMAAWIVSHCSTHSKREAIAEELGRYITVDVYGKCGNFSCDVPKAEAMSGIDCRFQISSKYKFYLSFENSLCEDYVTEKYFDALYTEMVPIVYGAAKYSEFAPPKSYIDVNDFGSIESLADHLIFLDKHPEEYLKYFEWRKDYWVQNNRFVLGYCDLCKKLWDQDSQPEKIHTYPSIYDWWDQRSDFKLSDEKSCYPPTRLNIFPKEKMLVPAPEES